MRKLFLPLFAALALCLGLVSGALASSHGSIYRTIAQSTGIVMPLPQHGQLPVLAEYRAPIWSLAGQAAPNDPVIAQLATYAHKQYAACWYGLFPASLADVESPFHLCSHGYLAASHAMLVRLAEVAPTAAVLSLNRQFNAAMQVAQNSPGFSLCVNGTQQLNTSEILHPRWPDIEKYVKEQLHEHRADLQATGLRLALLLVLSIGIPLAVRRRFNPASA